MKRIQQIQVSENGRFRWANMYLVRILLAVTLFFIAPFTTQAQQSATKDWSITDYFKSLPERYITASGDFPKPSAETIVVDEKSGYAAAYLNSPPTESGGEAFPVFEMALFKSQTKPPLLVVANTKSDPVCTDYETFFLRRAGSGWTEVGREVLPPLDLKMFWDKPQSAVRFLNIVQRDNAASYHFEPPRQGTRMKVSLEICDYFLEVTPMKSVDELRKLIESARPIYLNWDKQKGKFVLAE